VITTPLGFMPRDEVDGNPLEAHISGWEPKEVEKLGYRVKKQGVRILFGNEGVVHRKPYSLLSKIIFMAEPFLNILLNFIQSLADYYIICCKELR
jgi:hypothetical protein